MTFARLQKCSMLEEMISTVIKLSTPTPFITFFIAAPACFAVAIVLGSEL